MSTFDGIGFFFTAILMMAAFITGVAYLVAPFMLFAVFSRVGRTNELLTTQNLLLTQLLVAGHEYPTPTPINAVPVSVSYNAVPTFDLLR